MDMNKKFMMIGLDFVKHVKVRTRTQGLISFLVSEIVTPHAGEIRRE